jgi:hypothetical protein
MSYIMPFRLPRLFATVLVLAAPPLARAASVGDFVTFETLTDALTAPTDNATLAISDPYQLNNGVTLRFRFRNEDTLQFTDAGRFEKRGGGDNTRGFLSSNGTGNEDTGRTAKLNDQLGLFFLRSPEGQLQAGDVGLRIDYGNNAGMRYAAGEIWDIDGDPPNHSERWQIDAFNAANQIIASQTSPLGIVRDDPNSLDSLPWLFEFSTHQDIAYIKVEFIGTKAEGVGLAFNNFTTAITLPADFDVDLDVDNIDLGLWRQAFGASSGGDANHDGRSDGTDFLIWQTERGMSVAPVPAASVPEPTAIGLVTVTVFLACIWQRR